MTSGGRVTDDGGQRDVLEAEREGRGTPPTSPPPPVARAAEAAHRGEAAESHGAATAARPAGLRVAEAEALRGEAPPLPVRVKICCIQSADEARTAVRHGAAAIGLVSAMPSGPGPIPADRIRAIAATVPSGVGTFLLTAATDAATIVRQARDLGVSTVQLVDRTPREVHRTVKKALPRIAIVQVVHVVDESSLVEAREVSRRVDALLLDSGRPDLPVRELGGTGRVHDWALSREIRASVDVPVYLAGGLRADNVREAIETVRPFAVDLCTGVRRGGRLDEDLLAGFMVAVRATAA